MPSIVEIARLAQVSPSTVSRFFRGNSYVSDEVRQRILKVSSELAYTPKKYTKRHASPGNDALVGVVVADLQNPFFLQIIESLTRVLDDHSINVVIFNSDENPQREIRCLNTLVQRNVSGIIISPVSETAEYNSEFIKDLGRSYIPVILVDRDLKGIGFDGVFQDCFNGSFAAVSTLISLGHRHIATIAGPLSTKPGLDRLNGYLDALKNHDLLIRQEYILYGDFKMDSGYDLTRQLLQQNPQVTAIFCANNLMAVGALRAIHDAGLSIPEDIAFISYGSLNQYDLYQNARITELCEPTELMGDECAHMMLAKMAEGKKKEKNQNNKRITFDARLILKGSEVYPTHKLSALGEANR